MSFESHVNPSPSDHQSTPKERAAISSPERHAPDFTNCTTATLPPAETERSITPIAADDLPLPAPVWTRTRDVTRFDARTGRRVGGSLVGDR